MLPISSNTCVSAPVDVQQRDSLLQLEKILKLTDEILTPKEISSCAPSPLQGDPITKESLAEKREALLQLAQTPAENNFFTVANYTKGQFLTFAEGHELVKHLTLTDGDILMSNLAEQFASFITLDRVS